MNTRRAELKLIYEGVDISQDIAPFLLSFSYTDYGTGNADDLQITLADREGKWKDPWLPEDGDKVKAEIVIHNWLTEGAKHSFRCGSFYVDTANFSGPPDVVVVEGTSLKNNADIKTEERTKAWENISLSQIAGSIAKSAGLNLMFEASDLHYDRIDQTQQSDLAFLNQLATKEAMTVKVTNDTLVVFDDRKFESLKPVRTLTKGESNIKHFDFNISTIGVAYCACEVTYYDESKKQNITGVFHAPDIKEGPVLKINERVSSVAEATRRARTSLRQANKEARKATLTLMGDFALVQGVTVNVVGFGKFDGKYFVEVAKHSLTRNGYETRVDLRKVLNY